MNHTLDDLTEALNVSKVCRKRDVYGGGPRLEGKRGKIYAQPEGFYIFHDAETLRTWGFAKKEMAFCKVTQDGDTEGVFLLDRLPTEDEATIIRDRLKLTKRRTMTEAALESVVRARARSPLESIKGRAK